MTYKEAIKWQDAFGRTYQLCSCKEVNEAIDMAKDALKKVETLDKRLKDIYGVSDDDMVSVLLDALQDLENEKNGIAAEKKWKAVLLTNETVEEWEEYKKSKQQATKTSEGGEK